MKIAFESELMQNQKHAEVMAPELAFEALQTRDGYSLFFSIGTDGVLYLTQESGGAKTGWSRIDLSSTLSALHGAPVAAKMFDVSQNARTGDIDLVLAVTAGGADFLYVSQGNDNADASWAAGVRWTAVPFDDPAAPMPARTITDVYVLQADGAESIVVDVLKEPATPLNLIDRYNVTPAAPQKWSPHHLAFDLSAGGITSRLGKRAADLVAGTYTFGTIVGRRELVYTPLYNPFNPSIPPNPARLSLPAGATAMAPARGVDGTSSLFVAGKGTLHLFTPDNQRDGAAPVQVAANPIFAGVRTLSAAATATATAVWGINAQGQLFYLRCAAGRETDPGAWSYPLPLLSAVEQIASFLNPGQDNSVVFAHTQGNSLVQLTQDPVTTTWRRRGILLPSTDPDDVVRFTSYTTHLRVTDDYNAGVGGAALSLTSASPVGVYLNDIYYVLSPDAAVCVETDPTGVLTVVQPTHGLAAVCYEVAVPSAGIAAVVNPMSKVMERLSGIRGGDDLASAEVANADGTRRKLLPPGVSAEQAAAAAQAVQQLVKVGGSLPQSGVTAASAPGTAPGSAAAGPAAGFAAPLPAAAPESIVRVAAGDLFSWLHQLADDVVQEIDLVVQTAENAWHCVVTWAGQVFHAVLDDLGSVLQGIEWVLKKIAVGIEDTVQFLGFLFEWGDIVRTHNVLKNLLKVCMAHATAELGTAEDEIRKFFGGLEHAINAWAEIPDTPDTIGGYQASTSSLPGQDSPQSNWALHHVKSNLHALTTGDTAPVGGGTPDGAMNPLTALLQNEERAFETLVNQIKTQIIEPWHTLTPVQAVKKLLAIVADLLLTSAENVIITLIEVLRPLADALMELLDAPITIPILSPLYREMSGNELSVLDLGCLVAAVPATITYKLITGRAPFSDNATTAALIAAPDLAAMQALLATGFPGSRTTAPPAADARGGIRAMMAPPPPPNDSHGASPPADTEPDTAGWFTIFLNFTGVAGTALVLVTNSLKKASSQPSLGLRSAASIGYLMYAAPNFSTFHKAGLYLPNTTITMVCILKTFADNFCPAEGDDPSNPLKPCNYLPKPNSRGSASLDAFANIIWLSVAIAIFLDLPEKTTVDWFSLVGNCASDLGGLTPLAAKLGFGKEDAYLWTQVLAGTYGAMCLASAIAESVAD